LKYEDRVRRGGKNSAKKTKGKQPFLWGGDAKGLETTHLEMSSKKKVKKNSPRETPRGGRKNKGGGDEPPP